MKGVDSEAAFAVDSKTQSAVLYQVAVIGEATKRLSRSYRVAHPQVPWREMAGMRDVLIHDYDSVDAGEVWRVTQRDIPVLLSLIEPLLPPEEE